MTDRPTQTHSCAYRRLVTLQAWPAASSCGASATLAGYCSAGPYSGAWRSVSCRVLPASAALVAPGDRLSFNPRLWTFKRWIEFSVPHCLCWIFKILAESTVSNVQRCKMYRLQIFQLKQSSSMSSFVPHLSVLNSHPFIIYTWLKYLPKSCRMHAIWSFKAYMYFACPSIRTWNDTVYGRLNMKTKYSHHHSMITICDAIKSGSGTSSLHQSITNSTNSVPSIMPRFGKDFFELVKPQV